MVEIDKTKIHSFSFLCRHHDDISRVEIELEVLDVAIGIHDGCYDGLALPLNTVACLDLRDSYLVAVLPDACFLSPDHPFFTDSYHNK